MIGPKVWMFFYGSYMNFDVLREVDLVPEQWQVARLYGFDIRIHPRANLTWSDQHCVYGIGATATHAELSWLYAHAKDILGELYLPEAVLVERILQPAKQFGFPAWYIQRLESFRPA